MSHFVVLAMLPPEVDNSAVEDALNRLMAPYQENNMGDCPPEFMVFTDQEDEFKKEYESEGAEVVVLTNGDWKFEHDKSFKVLDPRSTNPFDKTKVQLPEGAVKKELPFKQIYPTFAQFCADWHGKPNRDPKKDRYGYWDNPHKKYDWFVIGGRWRGNLRVKPGAKHTVVSEDRSLPFEKKQALAATDVDVCRIQDLDLKWYEKQAVINVKKFWNEVRALIQMEKDEAADHPGTRRGEGKYDEKAAKAYHAEIAKKFNLDEQDIPVLAFYQCERARELGILEVSGKGEKKKRVWKLPKTEAEFVKKYQSFFGFQSWAVVTPKGWFEKAEMGWWGLHSGKPEECQKWKETFFERFIEKADPKTWLVTVDCHI